MWYKRKVQNSFLANNILFVAVRLTSKNYKWQILSYIKALNQPNCWTLHVLYQPFANVYDRADCFLPWFSLNWTWFKWLHRVQMCSGTALMFFLPLFLIAQMIFFLLECFLKGNSFIWHHFRIKRFASLCILLSVFVTPQYVLVHLCSVRYCFCLSLTYSKDQVWRSVLQMKSDRKSKKEKPLMVVSMCTYWCLDSIFFPAVDWHFIVPLVGKSVWWQANHLSIA